MDVGQLAGVDYVGKLSCGGLLSDSVAGRRKYCITNLATTLLKSLPPVIIEAFTPLTHKTDSLPINIIYEKLHPPLEKNAKQATIHEMS